MYAEITFTVNVYGKFNNEDECLEWLKSNHTFDSADNCTYPYYTTPVFTLLEKTHYSGVYAVSVSLYAIEKMKREQMIFDIEYFVENIDDDGNYPVNGQLVSLSLIPDSLRIMCNLE
jgi:hypothetical protein